MKIDKEIDLRELYILSVWVNWGCIYGQNEKHTDANPKSILRLKKLAGKIWAKSAAGLSPKYVYSYKEFNLVVYLLLDFHSFEINTKLQPAVGS